MSCLLSCLFRHFFLDTFLSGVGIIIFKTFVFTALGLAWLFVDGLASFKSEVDCRTGGTEGFWLSDWI